MSIPPPSSRASARKAREEAERGHADARRSQLIVAGGVILTVLLVVLVGWWLTHRNASAEPSPTPSPSDTSLIQPTLLLQIRDDQQIAVDNSILSVGGSLGRGVMMLVPSQLIVDAPTGGTLPLGQVARLPDSSASANTLSDLLGVRVDATFAMERLAFSGLVDAVGGVTVVVDADLVTKKPDGSVVILVPAGTQKLDGPAAATYATFLAPGEPEEARMARLAQVWRLVVGQLPADQSKIEAILTSLGALARSTVPTPQIAAFLTRLHYDVIADDVVYRNLPVKPIDAGSTELQAYRVDTEPADAMVADLFPQALRVPGPNSKVRVLVQNGAGTPGLNAAARQDLVDAGFSYVNGGNAETFGLAQTAVIIPDAGAAARQWGTDIAAALKVPATAVQVATESQSVADVVVVLGADFTAQPAP